MKTKLLLKDDCAVGCVISCSPVEMLIIYKALRVTLADENFAESDRKIAERMGKDMTNFEEIEL